MGEQIMSFFRENTLFIILLLVLAGGFIFLRTKDSNLASLSEFDTLITSGQPVVVEFFSNT